MGGTAILVLLGLVVAGWLWYQFSETRRDMALDQVARRLGMNFRFGLPQELKDALGRFRAIEKVQEKGGEFQAGINSITGTRRARKIAFFDYRWVTVIYSSRRRRSIWGGNYDDLPIRRNHERSAVAAQLGVSLPPLLIRPERLVDKALALVGYEDIDFSDQPEFSGRFYVNGPDRAFARRLVTPALARFFLENVRHTVDITGGWLLLHNDGRLPASRVGELLELASVIAERVTREQSC